MYRHNLSTCGFPGFFLREGTFCPRIHSLCFPKWQAQNVHTRGTKCPHRSGTFCPQSRHILSTLKGHNLSTSQAQSVHSHGTFRPLGHFSGPLFSTAPGFPTITLTSRCQVVKKTNKEKVLKTSILYPSSISAARLIHKYSFFIHWQFLKT